MPEPQLKLVVALDWVKFLLVFLWIKITIVHDIGIRNIYRAEYGRYEVQLGSAVSPKNRSLDRASIKRASLYLYFLGYLR
jgi:hypothetical protein